MATRESFVKSKTSKYVNTFELLVMNDVLYMDSRDIARMVGKRHTHVLRDIDRMLEEVFEGEGRSPKNGTSCIAKSYINSNNVEAKYYLLDYELTMTLVTGYSVRLRNLIIKRWMVLERGRSKERSESKVSRNLFTETLRKRGYVERHEYISTTVQMKRPHGITARKADMTERELSLVRVSEYLARLMLTDERGYGEVNPVCVRASRIVSEAVPALPE